MSKLILCFMITVGMCVSTLGQNTTAFAELDKRVRAERGGWAGSKQPFAAAFNDERERLGDDFESELMKYIGNDVEKHYWVASFLVAPSYLHDKKPLPELSLRIMNQALTSLRGKTDEESLGYTVKLNINAARLSARMGLNAQAVQHKSEAEKLLALDNKFRAWVPIVDEGERKFYNRIGINAEQLKALEAKEAEEAKIPKAKVNSGILDNRAISKPKPSYPQAAKDAKASGKVRVGIVYDETGKVIWARAFEGNKLLYEAAEQAAMQARFDTFLLSGTPVKVSGSLTYDFKR